MRFTIDARFDRNRVAMPGHDRIAVVGRLDDFGLESPENRKVECDAFARQGLLVTSSVSIARIAHAVTISNKRSRNIFCVAPPVAPIFSLALTKSLPQQPRFTADAELRRIPHLPPQSPPVSGSERSPGARFSA